MLLLQGKEERNGKGREPGKREEKGEGKKEGKTYAGRKREVLLQECDSLFLLRLHQSQPTGTL